MLRCWQKLELECGTCYFLALNCVVKKFFDRN